MLKIVSHSKEKTTEVALENINPLRHNLWIDLENPSPKELVDISHKFSIPLVELKHALDPNERPRIKSTNDYNLIIFSSPSTPRGYDSPKKRTNPLGIIFGKRFVITIHKEKINTIDEIETNSNKFKERFGKGLDYFLFDMLSSITKEFNSIVGKIDDDLDDIEEEVLKGDQGILQKISSSKKSLMALRKSSAGNREVVVSIIKSKLFKQTKLFEELYVETTQFSEQIELHKERVSSALDIYFTYNSNKMNETMKSFTIIASLLLLPMLITSFYGMNIMLPLQKHPYSFFIMLVIILSATFLMAIYFKKKRWV